MGKRVSKIENDFNEIEKFLSLDKYKDLKPKNAKTKEQYEKSRLAKIKLSEITTAVDTSILTLYKKKYSEIKSEEFDLLYENSNKIRSMQNILGNLLEEYLAENISSSGWIWCSGSMVKKTDFIKKNKDGTWTALQVKNRENTENSASKSVRDGTDIIKWHRFNSTSGKTNWGKFPDDKAKKKLSENGFIKFLENYEF